MSILTVYTDTTTLLLLHFLAELSFIPSQKEFSQ